MTKKQKAYRAAALKGWRTRRAESKKRSAAARKGWRTRKATKTPRAKQTHGKPESKLWRVTVSAPYFRRGRRSRGSISSAYMVRGWYATKAQAQAAVPELKKRAIRGRAKIVRESKAWIRVDKVSVEITQVRYDARLLDTIEERDEVAE